MDYRCVFLCHPSNLKKMECLYGACCLLLVIVFTTCAYLTTKYFRDTSSLSGIFKCLNLNMLLLTLQ